MNRRSYGILAAVAFSFGCLWFFRAFRKLLFPSDHRYFDAGGPGFYEYGAVLCCVLIVFAVFFLILVAATKIKNRFGDLFALMFLGLGLAAFGSLSAEIVTWFSPTTNRFVNLPVPIIIFILCVVIAIRKGISLKAVTDNLVAAALIALPFGILLSANTLYRMASGGEAPLVPAQIESPVDLNASTPSTGRIIWIIFDELDWATLTNMPHDSDVSAFNELMTNSFVAENAFSPDFDTRDSIPALLTGKLVNIANPTSASNLSLMLADGGEQVDLKNTDTIFTDAQKAGYRSSIVGWYHPYPRVFEGKVDNAYWFPAKAPFCSAFQSCFIRTFQESLESIPGLMRVFPALQPHEFILADQFAFQVDRVGSMSQLASRLIQRPDTSFYLLHFSAPHDPYISRRGEPTGNYIDCVGAADELLRTLIEELRNNGNFEKSTIIVSADHWWRDKSLGAYSYISDGEKKESIVADIRIPFIVKMPGDSSPVEYRPEFNTVITRKLINAIIAGSVKSNSDVGSFIDQIALEQPDVVGFRPKPRAN